MTASAEYRGLAPNKVMTTDLDIIADFDRYYYQAYYAWDPLFPLCERDLRMFLGDQWDEKEKQQLFQDGRSTFVFNRIRRTINMVTGYQKKNRLSSVVVPIEDSSQKTADQLSKLLLFALQSADGYSMISECFGGALKTGWNLMNIWMDYREDPVNGDIKFGRDPYNGFIVDPYFSRLDFSDCQYIIRRKYLNVDHCASLLPGQEKDVFALYRMGWERDDKFTWLPYQRQPNGQELMAYNEFFLQKWRSIPMLVDMETGERTEFDMPKSEVKRFLDLYPTLQVVEMPKRYIERHIIVNDQLMRSEIDPYDLDEYPFVPFTCIFEPESDQWGIKIQSLVRCMIDPQREANRRRSQITDILDSQINSGWIANENSVINPRSLFQSSQGRVIWRREDAAPGALEKIQPAQIPPSLFQAQELFDRDLVEIAGVNDAAFGQIESANESGVMMMLRQGSAILNLQDVFDRLRDSQKAVSKKILKLIQNWSPEKVKRIIGEEPTPEFYDQNFTKYDIAVQEGLLTDSQKQIYFRQLLDLKQVGVPVTGEMLAKAAPMQGKTQLIEDIANMEKQQAQSQQQQMQIQQQLLDSQRQQAQAKAISDIALSKERFTRAVANMGLEDERASKAIQDRADSALSRVSAMRQLEAMDDDRIVKYLNIIRMMEDMNSVKENQIKSDDVDISARANQQQPNQNIPEVGNLLQELPTNNQEVANA